MYYIKRLNGSGKFIFREKSEFPDRPPGAVIRKVSGAKKVVLKLVDRGSESGG